jgi:predicted P-loop ATPase
MCRTMTSDVVPVDGQDLSWMEELEMDRKGNYYNTIDNLVLILENDPRLKATWFMTSSSNGRLPAGTCHGVR